MVSVERMVPDFLAIVYRHGADNCVKVLRFPSRVTDTAMRSLFD